MKGSNEKYERIAHAPMLLIQFQRCRKTPFWRSIECLTWCQRYLKSRQRLLLFEGKMIGVVKHWHHFLSWYERPRYVLRMASQNFPSFVGRKFTAFSFFEIIIFVRNSFDFRIHKPPRPCAAPVTLDWRLTTADSWFLSPESWREGSSSRASTSTDYLVLVLLWLLTLFAEIIIRCDDDVISY